MKTCQPLRFRGAFGPWRKRKSNPSLFQPSQNEIMHLTVFFLYPSSCIDPVQIPSRLIFLSSWLDCLMSLPLPNRWQLPNSWFESETFRLLSIPFSSSPCGIGDDVHVPRTSYSEYMTCRVNIIPFYSSLTKITLYIKLQHGNNCLSRQSLSLCCLVCSNVLSLAKEFPVPWERRWCDYRHRLALVPRLSSTTIYV